ncbi:MAG: DUF58 domain-containing protein [Planctomycetaceae bacterium]|jgi:hypothetical protein|nr:DUF58 domain-containing protein [Planctomycetaceae bacterium]
MKWVIAVLLVLGFSFVIGSDLLAYAMYSLLSLMAASLWLSKNWAAQLSATRECSQLKADIDDHVGIELEVTNRGKLPVPWILLEDMLSKKAFSHSPPSLELQSSRIKLTMLRANQSKKLQYHFKCNRRGFYQLGPVVLETGDLFGLHRRFQIRSKPQYLTVYPKVVPIDGYELSSRRPIGEIKMTHRLFEDPTRIAGVRAYQEGDPLNRIHWRATARTGKLQSKIYESSTVAGLTVILDFHEKAFQRQHEPIRSELAVTAAVSVANTVQLLGHQVGLLTNGRDAAERMRRQGWDIELGNRQQARQAGAMLTDNDRLKPLQVPTQRSSEQFYRIQELLARIEFSDGLEFGPLLLESQSRIPRDATVLAIISKQNPQSTIALENMVRQGFAVSAMINVFEPTEYARVSGPLIAAGITTYHLRDNDSIIHVCRKQILR